MDGTQDPERAQSNEIARLGQELEQARVLLEDAAVEIRMLSEERDRLRGEVAVHEAARMDAEAAARKAKDSAVALASAAQQAEQTASLQTALEEASVLAEELQTVNEQLRLANEDLDHRVSERTAALEAANGELAQINGELQARVEAETSARTQVQAELFQMQKLEAIGQLTGGIAHDFNNLLMVIMNGLQVLEQSSSAAQRQRALRRTQEASWRAAELTRRLLAFARRQALHPERVDLTQQADSLRELLGQGLREDIQLSLDIPADVWPLEADLGALELALLNLTVNARDAMPTGGVLRITARNNALDADFARRRAVGSGDYVLVSIQDNGVGMTPDVLEKVFEPFFTTKDSGKGTGLGLAQVFGFAQQSGGTAWVESQPGEGTQVHLLLPRSSREQAVAPVPQATASGTARQQDLRVLVVEDEPAVAAVVLEMLAHLGHHGRSVGTVASALALLASGDRTDVVLSDVLLPGGESGLDLAREVRQRQLGVPVILTSGYGGSMTQRLSTMNLPFLRKPYRSEALEQALESAMLSAGDLTAAD